MNMHHQQDDTGGILLALLSLVGLLAFIGIIAVVNILFFM